MSLNFTFFSYVVYHPPVPPSNPPGPDEEFTIHLSGYSGTAGDSLMDTSATSSSNGMKLSTADNDNDPHPSKNKAEIIEAPWWWNYNSLSALNGVYEGAAWRAPYWSSFTNDAIPLTSTAMKLHQIPQ